VRESSSRQHEQRRVLELMRRRGRASSVEVLKTHMQELEREIERLRRGTRGSTT
jgi:hypothetical protein